MCLDTSTRAFAQLTIALATSVFDVNVLYLRMHTHSHTHAGKYICFKGFCGFVMTLIDLQLHFAFVGFTYIIIGGGFCLESTESLSQQCDGGWHSGCLVVWRLCASVGRGIFKWDNNNSCFKCVGANTQQTGVSYRSSTSGNWLIFQSRGINRAN